MLVTWRCCLQQLARLPHSFVLSGSLHTLWSATCTRYDSTPAQAGTSSRIFQGAQSMRSLPAKLFVSASDRLVFFCAPPLELRCWPSPKPCAQHAAAGRRLLWRAPRPCSSAEGLQGRMHGTRRNITTLQVVRGTAQTSDVPSGSLRCSSAVSCACPGHLCLACVETAPSP